MNGKSKQNNRDAIFQDLVSLHQHISGCEAGAPDVSTPDSPDASVDSDDTHRRAFRFVDHIPMGVLFARVVRDRYRHPIDFKILFVNKRYADLVGCDRVSVLESAFYDVLPGGRGDWEAVVKTDVMKGRVARGLSLALHTDAQLNVLLFLSDRDTLAVVIDDGRQWPLQASMLSTYTDVDSLLQSSSLLVCRWVPGGQLLYANRAYEHYFGGKWNTLTAPSYMPSIPSADIDFVRSQVELMRRDHPAVSYTVCYACEEKGKRWVQWNEEAVVDADGRIVGYQAVGTDVSAYMESQHEMQRVEGLMRDLLDFQATRNREHVHTHSHNSQNERTIAVEKQQLKRQLATLERTHISGELEVCSRCARIHDSQGAWMLPHVFLALKSTATVSSGVCPYCKRKADTEFKDGL
jgi:PAS domain S-box-containing protein